MSATLLKAGHETTDAFNAVKSQRLMKDDVRTTAFLASHVELRLAAQETVAALFKAFERADVHVMIDEDPDSGHERLLFEVFTDGNGRELRRRLREFVREDLPASAREVRDLLVFSVGVA